MSQANVNANKFAMGLSAHRDYVHLNNLALFIGAGVMVVVAVCFYRNEIKQRVLTFVYV